MLRFVAASLRRKPIALGAFVLAALAAGQGARAEIVGAPVDLSASVHEGLLSGSTIFEDSHSVIGAEPTPKQSAEYLYIASRGDDPTNRHLGGAFVSSLAESDGNGGVGVSQLLGGGASNADPGAVEQLAAGALWTQTFTYNGTIPASISLHLHIPALTAGLIGVAPLRSSFSATETAEARATLTSEITHSDLTFSKGGSFDFGLHVYEHQIASGPSTIVNFADFDLIGDAPPPVQGGPDDTTFFLDPVSADVHLGTLQPGDTISYVYQLIAEGTTHGFEHGYVAFVGDPFGADVISDSLVLSLTTDGAAAPEPATWLMMMVGLAFLGFAARRAPSTV
jgi:hypothetical protein